MGVGNGIQFQQLQEEGNFQIDGGRRNGGRKRRGSRASPQPSVAQSMSMTSAGPGTASTLQLQQAQLQLQQLEQRTREMQRQLREQFLAEISGMTWQQQVAILAYDPNCAQFGTEAEFMHQFLQGVQAAHMPLSEGEVAMIRSIAAQFQRPATSVLVEVPDEEGPAPGEEQMAEASHVVGDHAAATSGNN